MNPKAMNKKTILSFIFSICTAFLFGQKKEQIVDLSNCRDGEKIEYCHTHKKMNEFLSDPKKLKEYQEYEDEIQGIIYKMEHEKSGNEKATIYKIPIVFHILHNNGAENISREQILDEVANLNKDFRKLNPDVNDVVSQFQTKQADIEIEFVLANRDPLGRSFNGITRTIDAITSDGSDGYAQSDAVMTKNDTYKGDWPGNKYLNVFVVANAGATAAGYTRQPNNDVNMTNGIWILHNYVGTIGTSSANSNHTLTHEIGHWLNLAHTWGNTNNPGVACGDDNVSDTPITKGFTTCNLNSSAICTSGVTENVENFMEYSYCSKMFTEGQKTRMRAALINSRGGRNNIWTSTNLNSVAPLTIAEIQADRTIICAGSQVNLSDVSFSQATSWNWTISGGSPSISTLKNPSVTYSTPGYYEVKLTSSFNGTSVSTSRTQYIQVLPSTSIFPIYESFQYYNQLFDINKWARYDQGGNRPFEIYTGAGFSDNKCVKLANFDETTPSTLDELNSEIIDLSQVSLSDPLTLTFKYSYRKKMISNYEALKIAVSTDCGSSWFVRNSITGNYLSGIATTEAWVPKSQSDWTTVHVTQITSQFYKSNFRFKFQFTGNGGNNLYLDDINLYKGAPSESIVLGMNEINLELSDFELYPNPTEGELNIHFNIAKDNEVYLSIEDLSGKTLQTQKINGINGSNLVLLNTQTLTSGMYLLKTQIGNIQKVSPFIVK
jgi:PKD repeat protein